MADVVSPEVRSRMMAGIRGTNTKPELAIRSGLHRRGFRFRIHDRRLPGKPDLVLPRYCALIFVHGCFWHGHDCHLFKWPGSRVDFWRKKIERNRAVDLAATAKLTEQGWRIATVWECALKGRERLPIEAVLDRCEAWLLSGGPILNVRGEPAGDKARTSGGLLRGRGRKAAERGRG